MREIKSSEWLTEHRALLDQGFVRFEYLTAVHLGEENFEVISKVSNADLSQSELLSIKITGELESITGIYLNAQFHEREAAQMFGINFKSLANVEPAFDADFGGHPLRKDFALTKRVAKNWPGAVEPGDTAKARRRPSLPPGVSESWIQSEQAK